MDVSFPHNHGKKIDKIVDFIPSIEDSAKVAEVFKQLSDGSRIRILWILCHCEECVSNISAAVNMSDPAVSHHLKQLKQSGLVVSRREGKEIYYKISNSEYAEFVHHTIEKMFDIKCPDSKLYDD